MALLTKLILAHIISDFIFQPNAWIENKNLKKIKSRLLYFHVLIYGAITWLIVFDIKFWKQIMILTISHYLIDLLKLYINKKSNQRLWFFLDQIIHIIIILIIWWLHIPSKQDISFILDSDILLIITSFIFITKPASIIIYNIISKWEVNKEDNYNDSLRNAGKYIGILERIFILIFILSNHWEGIGFLLAAKSVFVLVI